MDTTVRNRLNRVLKNIAGTHYPWKNTKREIKPDGMLSEYVHYDDNCMTVVTVRSTTDNGHPYHITSCEVIARLIHTYTDSDGYRHKESIAQAVMRDGGDFVMFVQDDIDGCFTVRSFTVVLQILRNLEKNQVIYDNHAEWLRDVEKGVRDADE